MADIIDINITPVVEEITLTIAPNLTTINVNTQTGGGGAVDSVNDLTGVVQIGLESVLNQSDRPIKNVSASTYSFIAEDKSKLITASEIANYTLNKNIFPIGTVLKVLPLSGDIAILRGAGISLVSNGNSDKTVTSNTIALLTHISGSGGADEYWTFNVIPISASSGVPYTGATSDVNLGEFALLTGNLEFDNTPTNLPTNSGSVYYNDTDGTLDLILKGGNVKLQIGQEQVVRVVNKTATNINLLQSNYQAVRVTGAQGQRMKVDLAQATNDLLSAETIGLVTETINNNQEGFITTSGLVRNINTTGSLQGETWVDGDIIYLSPTTAGNLTKVKPVAPNHLVVMGYVIYAHATQGSIFVKVDNGYELDELHNVDTSESKATPIDADSLLLQDTDDSNIWKKLTWENLKATLKTYFDGIYQVKMIKQGYTQLSGVTGTQILTSLLIPANWIASGDGIEIVFTPNKSVTASAITFGIYHDTTLNGVSNAIATGTNLTTSQRTGYMQRVLVLDSSTLRNSIPVSASSLIPIAGNTLGATTTFNPTVSNYITLTVNPTVISEVTGFNQFYIRKL